MGLDLISTGHSKARVHVSAGRPAVSAAAEARTFPQAALGHYYVRARCGMSVWDANEVRAAPGTLLGLSDDARAAMLEGLVSCKTCRRLMHLTTTAKPHTRSGRCSVCRQGPRWIWCLSTDIGACGRCMQNGLVSLDAAEEARGVAR